MTVEEEFKSGYVGWEILFIFIAGALGDMGVHFLGEFTLYLSKKLSTNKILFAQGLLEYYKSLGDKLLIFDTSKFSKSFKSVSSWIQGAIWGGIACVIALLIAKLFMYAKEENEK